MKKTWITLVSAFMLVFMPLMAQTGIAVGAHVLNQYALGDWAEYAKANIGVGADFEYTLPLNLPKELALGTSIRVEYSHTLPKADSTLARDDSIRLSAGLFCRIPFAISSQNFAIQPEVGYMADLHNVEARNGSSANGWFVDSALTFALGLRYLLPVDITNLELELAPLYNMNPEKNGFSMNNLGFRFGALYRL